LFAEGALTNVTDVVVEPTYGYLARITYKDGTHRITYGNDLGLNTSAAGELARDKGHTKFLLRAIGINCPDGEEFLLPWWAATIGLSQTRRGNDSIKTASMAPAYIHERLGYPVYVKPVDGSKGADVFKVHTEGELDAVFDAYETKRVRVAVVEEPIAMPDYRIVVLDGELISAYQRVPLTVIGDGNSTLHEIVTQLEQGYFQAGRDTRIDMEDPRMEQHLRAQGLDLTYRPALNQAVVLTSVSNLSTGGTSKDVTGVISQRWIDLATNVASNFNLRLCGLDLGCADITDGNSAYSVLEVNAAPGLDHYALSGEEQKRLVHQFYTRVLNASGGVSFEGPQAATGKTPLA
jgi:D-alanine-D-alanine ligase-like ATP-grasp enzyme